MNRSVKEVIFRFSIFNRIITTGYNTFGPSILFFWEINKGTKTKVYRFNLSTQAFTKDAYPVPCATGEIIKNPKKALDTAFAKSRLYTNIWENDWLKSEKRKNAINAFLKNEEQ